MKPNLTLHKYRLEIILTVVLGMISLLSWPTAVGATEERLELDKFKVTGSHIKRTDFEGMSSVVVMDQAFIEKHLENLKIEYMDYDWDLNDQP